MRTPVYIVCETCGERKRFPPSAIQRGKRFCSLACYDKRGSANPKWRGGRSEYRGRAFVYAPSHPNARGPQMPEHRLIASEQLGRALLPGEVVHHINGDKSDNRPGNLQVVSQSEHIKLHLREMHAKLAATAWTRPRGTQVGTSVLTEELVLSMRERYRAGETQSSIARSVGVDRRTAAMAITRQTWGWL